MRRKLLVSYIMLVICLLSVSTLAFYSKTQELYMDTLAADMEKQGELLIRILQEESPSESGLQDLVRDYGDLLDCRITIIAGDGRVMADSLEDPQRMENHGDREEVKLALEGKTGSSLRESTVQGEQLYYYALPFTDQGENRALRFSVSTSAVKGLGLQYMAVGIVIMAVGVVISIFLYIIFIRHLTEPLQELMQSAQQITDGDYGVTIRNYSEEEYAKVSQAFQHMLRELNRNLQDLRERNLELEAVLNSDINGILALDLSGNVILYNEQVKDLLSISSESLQGKSLYQLVRHDDLYRVAEHAMAKQQFRRVDAEFEQNGSRRIYRIYANPIRPRDSKESIGLLMVIEDITNVIRLENVRKDFVSNVTHELKTPLTSIRGFIDTLKQGAVEDRAVAYRFLDIIEMESDRLYRLIQDILYLSEIENRPGEEEALEEVSVEEIAAQVLEVLDSKISQKNLDIFWEVQQDVKVRCEPDKLKQLLMNLVDNAVKYTEEGSITIRAWKAQGNSMIQVQDTGIGIAKEHLERIFERFYRVDKGRSRKMGGTGLGLSIAKHVVERYGGELQVSSEVGKGSSFTARFPAPVDENKKPSDSK
ncbi:ATP-binding protein [Bianquea renquensis]|uniref:histidine kinase n=1 Tax=Bianquea renquensis TaxID=2763661 RepID=A0A926HX23_9FIRM|nr:ATP-binding protein [Bianquea renquensis]MBC8543317.1 PAS domain-containing protein [Bianquea renquensis]